jgi:peptidoglycan/xylan/chitin deacetylase (PgdA/CDA1 family)
MVLLALVLAACGGASSTPQHGATTGAAAIRSHRPDREQLARRIPNLIPPPNAPARSVRVPVLTYHRVHTLPAVGQPDLIVDPATFDAELTALANAGYHTISQAQLFGALYHGDVLPSNPVLISVDDGYVDDARTILPDLERHHMLATFFVITGRVNEPGFLDVAQIRQLEDAGMDVGDHTADHLDLPGLPAAQLIHETAGSRHTLESILGHPVYYFAYPFGAYDATVIHAVQGAGFTMAYTTAAGTVETTAAPLEMPRLHVGRTASPTTLMALLHTR